MVVALACLAGRCEANAGVKVAVKNSYGHPAKVFWVSDKGEEVPMYDLKPGDTSNLNTYPGHNFAWVTSDKPDRRIKMAIKTGTQDGDKFELKEGRDGYVSVKKQAMVV